MNQPTAADKAKFWSKVDYFHSSGCWVWQGPTRNGYGVFGFGKQRQGTLTHRFAYETLVEIIPAGMTIDHLCRNKACVNLHHLEVVTPRENVLRAHSWPKALAVSAQHRREKTTCTHGHIYPDGLRVCRICANLRRRIKRASDYAKGERAGNVKLNEQQVREIRLSDASGRSLAHQFGVSTATVSLIRSGKNWKHVL